jgi:hypothetical protein
MICGRTTAFEGDRTPQDTQAMRDDCAYRAADGLLSALPLAEFPYPSTVAVRRDVVTAAGGFISDGWNGEDVDLYLRIGDSGGFAVIEDPPIAMRRRHAEQLNCNLDLAWAGIMRLVDRERTGLYAGGSAHAASRRRLIGECGRYYVPQLLAEKRWAKAIRLALPSLLWTLKYNAEVLPGWLRTCWSAARQ